MSLLAQNRRRLSPFNAHTESEQDPVVFREESMKEFRIEFLVMLLLGTGNEVTVIVAVRDVIFDV
jgi:hypothetical protein